MKAWLLDSVGGLDHLHLTEVPDSIPGPGEVVLAIRYAGLNPADRYLAEGQYPAKPSFPHILGRDGIGEVISRGPGAKTAVGEVRLVLRGDTGVNRAGTFAERVAVAEQSLVSPPSNWTEPESAGATLVYLTAYQALTQFGDLPPSVVLVTGATGGVGIASIQLAHAMGHTVVALSRSESKQRELAKLGVAVTLNPSVPDWHKKLKSLLSGRRVDLAIDNIGGPLFPQIIETLGEQGRISIVGRLAGPVPEFNTASLIFRRIRIGGVSVGAYGAHDGRLAWDRIVALLQTIGTKPLVDHVYPFEELIEAFNRLKIGPMGKVLLAVK